MQIPIYDTTASLMSICSLFFFAFTHNSASPCSTRNPVTRQNLLHVVDHRLLTLFFEDTMASHSTTCAVSSGNASASSAGSGYINQGLAPRESHRDPTKGDSLFMLMARGRLHEKETSSSSSFPRQPPLHDSLSSLTSSALDDDECPQRQNYDSHEEWLCAVLDASMQISFDQDTEQENATATSTSAPSQ